MRMGRNETPSLLLLLLLLLLLRRQWWWGLVVMVLLLLLVLVVVVGLLLVGVTCPMRGRVGGGSYWVLVVLLLLLGVMRVVRWKSAHRHHLSKWTGRGTPAAWSRPGSLFL